MLWGNDLTTAACNSLVYRVPSNRSKGTRFYLTLCSDLPAAFALIPTESMDATLNA